MSGIPDGTLETPVATERGRSAADAFDHFMDVLTEKLFQKRLTITLGCFTFGFLMLVISRTLGNSSVIFDGGLKNGYNAVATLSSASHPVRIAKEVGYLFALNWSLVSILVSPLVTFFGIGCMHAIHTSIERLANKRMLRDDHFKPLTSAEATDLWRNYMRHNRIIFVVVFVCVFAFMMSDWWKTVASPLLHAASFRASIKDPELEYDWSVCSLFHNSSVPTIPLFIFGLLDYIVLAGMLPALAFAIILSSLHFVVFITGAYNSTPKFHLAAIPDKTEGDKLCGYSTFYDLFDNLILSSLFVQFGLWCMTVQNVYLRNTTADVHNIFDFLYGDVQEAHDIVEGKRPPVEIVDWIISANKEFYPNMQVVLSFMITPFLILTSVVLCCILLRQHAGISKKFSLKHIRLLHAETKMKPHEIEESFDEMKVWPVGWMKQNEVIFLMVVLFASLFSYRLILLPLIYILLKAVEALVRIFSKKEE